MRGPSLRSLTLVLCETVLIVVAVALAAYLRLGDGAWDVLFFNDGVLKVAVIVIVTQGCLYYADLYDMRLMSDRPALFIGIVQALAAVSFILALVYYWFPNLVIGRGVFLIAAMLVITLVIGWRLAFDWTSRQVGPRERLLLVGTSAAAITPRAASCTNGGMSWASRSSGSPIRTRNWSGRRSSTPASSAPSTRFPTSSGRASVDRVVVSLADARGKLPMDKLLEMKLDGVSFDHLASVYEEYTGKIAVENLRPSWLIFSSGFRKSARPVLDEAGGRRRAVVGGPGRWRRR